MYGKVLYVLALFVSLDRSQTLEFLLHPRDVISPVNTNIVFSCMAVATKTTENSTPSLNTTYIWIHDGVRVAKSLEMSSNPSILQITSLSTEHIGEYYCLAVDGERELSSRLAKLEIAEPPEIQISPKFKIYPTGKEALLDCLSTRGYPTPKITWDISNLGHNGDESHIDFIRPTNHSIYIKSTVDLNSGAVYCHAQNIAGRAKAIGYLKFVKSNNIEN